MSSNTTIAYDLKSSDYFPSSCSIGSSTLSDYHEIIRKSSFCFISSLLPTFSSLKSKEQAICYQIKYDNINKKILVNIGSTYIECLTSGGTLQNPAGFKGRIECPKYINVCSYENNNIYVMKCLNA